MPTSTGPQRARSQVRTMVFPVTVAISDPVNTVVGDPFLTQIVPYRSMYVTCTSGPPLTARNCVLPSFHPTSCGLLRQRDKHQEPSEERVRDP